MATKTTKKKTNKISKTNQKLLEKSEALKKIHEHNRDYLSLTLTIPLGNKALKNVHTNQWLFTNLPKEFDLANWTILAEALNSNTNRFEKYIKNRWYIEGVDINVNADGKSEMKLTLNAFSSSLNSYSEMARDMQKAYTDATTKNTTTTTSNKNKSKAVSTGDNKAIKNGWWGEWVTKMVKSWVGNETDVLKNCKTVHEKFRWQTRWTRYYDMKYTGGSTKNLEKQWYRHKFNCGDGANYLSAFYSCCGATTSIHLGQTREGGHYVVKVVIGGKTYWCDHSGGEGAYNTLRGWNQTFDGLRSGSNKGRYV